MLFNLKMLALAIPAVISFNDVKAESFLALNENYVENKEFFIQYDDIKNGYEPADPIISDIDDEVSQEERYNNYAFNVKKEYKKNSLGDNFSK